MPTLVFAFAHPPLWGFGAAALLGLLTVHGPPRDDAAADYITSTAADLAKKIAAALGE